MEKVRVVKSKSLAGALVWLGFAYELDEDGNYVFKRDRSFDMAWRDLHSVKSMYRKPPKKDEEA